MNRRCSQLLAILTVVCLAGCTGSTTPPPPPVAADRAALFLTVKAEPKQGYRADGATAYSGRGLGAQFDTIDYTDLGDIVVWVCPKRPTTDRGNATPINRTIDVSIAGAQLLTAWRGDSWSLGNSGTTPRQLYIRWEDGRVFGLPAIQPGTRTPFNPPATGLYEIVDSITNRPIARVFVAPVQSWSPDWLKVARSDQKLTFNDLPPGPAEIGSWHPRLPGETRSVTLEAGKATQASISVGVNSLPKVP